VKGEWGTKFFDTSTECEDCGSRAVGVLKDVALHDETYKGIKAAVPLCSHHRDKVKAQNEEVWGDNTFQRFID